MAGRYLKRKKRNWKLITFLSVIGAAGVFLIGMWISTLSAPKEAEVPPATTAPMAETTQPPTEAPTTEPTEAETEAPTTEPTQPPETEPIEETVEQETEEPAAAQQPIALTERMEMSGVTYEELMQNNCSQLVTVVSEGTTAQIHYYACQDGLWEEQSALQCSGRVGRGGVSADKQEGDGSTPSGLYAIGSAFYITNQPDTKLDVFQITDETYWVDDPESAFYNQRAEGTQNKDWNSAEYMISYDVYRYGFVVDYNPQAIKNAGSAIFFHIGNTPTAGCIATEEQMVLDYLKELDRERNPHILIVSGDEA